MDLVFDRRAVTRADTFDDARVHRRTVEVRSNDFVGTGIGVGNPAAHLPRMHGLVAHERHHRNRRIARLLGHYREIHRATVDTWRGAGFQAADAQRQFTHAMGQGDCRRITGAAAGVVLQTNVDKSTEEGPGGQYHGVGEKTQTHLRHYTTHLVLFDDQVIAGLLKYPQVGLVLKNLAHYRFVDSAVGLGASSAYGRAFAVVQNTELDTALVSSQRHGAAERVNFLDQVALADATDGRVATHMTEGFHVVGQQQGFYTHACRRKRSLGTGMAAADDDHFKTGREIHHAPRACFGNR
ncbi:hypothetical protein D3C81_1293380 [compost metagenome]